MTILDILQKAAGAAGALVAVLNRAKAALPDLAPEVDKIITELNTAISANNLVALAEALPKEIANIAQGKLDPRDHPSDAA